MLLYPIFNNTVSMPERRNKKNTYHISYTPTRLHLSSSLMIFCMTKCFIGQQLPVYDLDRLTEFTAKPHGELAFRRLRLLIV